MALAEGNLCQPHCAVQLGKDIGRPVEMPHRRTKRRRTTDERSSTPTPKQQNQSGSSSKQSSSDQPHKRPRIAERKKNHFIRSQPVPERDDTSDVADSTMCDSEKEDKRHEAAIDDKVFLKETIDRLVSQVTLAQARPESSTATVSNDHDENQVTQPKKPLSDNRRPPGRPNAKIKKLGELIPNPIIKSSKSSRFTTMGHRQLGLPSSRLSPNYKIVTPLVLTISRRVNFSVYLKQSLDYFKNFKAGQIKLMAMGAAIPMCLSLALSIESQLPLGNSQTFRVRRSISTGTVIVGDEITPESSTSETDLIYQTRKQGSIEIQLSIKFSNQFKSIQQKLFS